MPASRWDNQSFTFSGDLVGKQVPSVTWEDSVFDPVGVNPILVGTDVAVEEALALALDPNIMMMGPHAAGAAGTLEVLVCGAIYVPPPFVSLVMHQDFTPRQAWGILGGAIVPAGKEFECRPLLNWLKVALTRAGVRLDSPVARVALTGAGRRSGSYGPPMATSC